MGKKIAIDTYYYSDTEAKTVGVIFNNWEDTEPSQILEAWTYEFGPYIPGEFYKRELPCMLDLLKKVPDLKDYDAIIIDGLAHLPPCQKESKDISEALSNGLEPPDGLGIRLEQALHDLGIVDRSTDYGINHVGIIGVAKSRFTGVDSDTGTSKIFRGNSKSPLYVNTTWFGYSSNSAGSCIMLMAGNGRIPTLLKLLDKLTKER